MRLLDDVSYARTSVERRCEMSAPALKDSEVRKLRSALKTVLCDGDTKCDSCKLIWRSWRKLLKAGRKK